MIEKKLRCAMCEKKVAEKDFSSKEKKKMNQRNCTPCVKNGRKNWQKDNRKDVLEQVYNRLVDGGKEPIESCDLVERKRREKERKELTPQFNTHIIQRDAGVCHYCGQAGKTVDHKQPIARGGDTSNENCVCSCHFCNNIKGHLTYKDFKKLKESFTTIEWSEMKQKYEQKNPRSK